MGILCYICVMKTGDADMPNGNSEEINKNLKKILELEYVNVQGFSLSHDNISAAGIVNRDKIPARFTFAEVKSISDLSSDKLEKNVEAKLEKINNKPAIIRVLGVPKTGDESKSLNDFFINASKNPINEEVTKSLVEAGVDPTTIEKLKSIRTRTEIDRINDLANHIFPQLPMYEWLKAGLDEKIAKILIENKFPNKCR